METTDGQLGAQLTEKSMHSEESGRRESGSEIICQDLPDSESVLNEKDFTRDESGKSEIAHR